MYCRTYKQASVAQSHSLLRKARRLDTILPANRDVEEYMAGNVVCWKCLSAFSPYFYKKKNSAPGFSSLWLCHRCFSENPQLAACCEDPFPSVSSFHGIEGASVEEVM